MIFFGGAKERDHSRKMWGRDVMVNRELRINESASLCASIVVVLIYIIYV